MNTNGTRNSSSVSRGLTLVEVVLGLSLLGTLLVSLILAHGRLLLEERRSLRKLEAIRSAEEFLRCSFSTMKTRKGEGKLPEHGFLWKTEVKDRGADGELPIEIVRLRIIDAKEGASDEVLAVEIAVPPEGRMKSP